MLIMSPRAVERLERFKHDRPLPKIFRMLKKDKEGVMRVDASIFQVRIALSSALSNPYLIPI